MTNFDNNSPFLPIEPYVVYSLKDAAKKLGVKNRKSIYKLAEPLKAKMVGNSWRVLGENILAYMSSPSILTHQMQLNKKDQNGLSSKGQAEPNGE